MNLVLALVASLFICLKAHARYECLLNLSHAEESGLIVGEKTIKAGTSEMRQKNEGTIVEESLEDKINLKSFMTGWTGEEEAVVQVFRGSESISEKYQLRGNDARTVWFDDYKMDVNCSIK
ncbi:hypothetical protein ACJVC5_19815 [Peredibacter sp. HCB2-198]|uniref:hypothetical protein n=1 Tax=Peredibacter sp. HCB2-198 TaxID=3383025 RepID=UPI0038B5B6D8